MFADPNDNNPASPLRLPSPAMGQENGDADGEHADADQAATVAPIEDPTLCELHARWALLFDEVDALHVEIDDVMHESMPTMTIEELNCFPEHLAAQRRAIGRTPVHGNVEILHAEAEELERRLAAISSNPEKFAVLQAKARDDLAMREAAFDARAHSLGFLPRVKRMRAAQAALDAVTDALWETPAETLDDIAALFDIALEEFDDRPGDDIWADWPWFCRIMQQLCELVPGFEFTWLRRHSPPGRDLVAEVLNVNDEKPLDEVEKTAPLAAE